MEGNKTVEKLKATANRKVTIGAVLAVVLIATLLILFIGPKVLKKPSKQEVVTVSTLEKVVKSSCVSDLHLLNMA